jgi:hypothetical protein
MLLGGGGCALLKILQGFQLDFKNYLIVTGHGVKENPFSKPAIALWKSSVQHVRVLHLITHEIDNPVRLLNS